MHSALYGVVSDFWDAVLVKKPRNGDLPVYAIPYAKRKLMTARGKRFKLPAEFGRHYRQACFMKRHHTLLCLNI